MSLVEKVKPLKISPTPRQYTLVGKNKVATSLLKQVGEVVPGDH